MSSPDVPAPAGASHLLPSAGSADTVRRTPVRRRRVLPVVALAVVGIACLVAVVPLYRHGVVAHPFPSYVQGDPVYEVRRYSAPWIGSAVALGGIGLVCWTVAVTLLRGRRPAAAAPAPVPLETFEPGLAPRPTEAAREF